MENKTVLSQLISKVLIHLLFWALFVFVSLFVFSNYYWRENPFLQYFFILAAIVYLNNGVLLPFFIQRKWYFLYTLLIGTIAFLGTQLYCNVFAQCGCSVMKCLSDYLWQTLVPIVFFSFLWLLYEFLGKQQQLERLTRENTEMELRFLKSQMNPHVLFNNLNTIYSYALEQPKKVPDLILMLSNNLKHVLYESNAEKVPLENELRFIDNYIEFQKLRTEGLKKVAYSKSLDSEKYLIAPLLLIALIENAFKHSAQRSTIYIDIKAVNATLTCSCKNEKRELPQDRNGNAIGLKNVKKRLELLYRNRHHLAITDTHEYQVTLTLQL